MHTIVGSLKPGKPPRRDQQETHHWCGCYNQQARPEGDSEELLHNSTARHKDRAWTGKTLTILLTITRLLGRL